MPQKSVNYIQNELEALEREQKQIDKQADVLEKYLRKIMESGELTVLYVQWDILSHAILPKLQNFDIKDVILFTKVPIANKRNC